MRGRLLYWALAVVLTIVVAGCDENLSDLTGPSPTLQPTFSSIQREIFDQTDSAGRAACIQCHTAVGRVPAGGLNLTSATSYAALVGVGSVLKPGAIRVIPGDPANSYLVQKLEGTPGIVGRRMPFLGPPFLTDGQILVIKRWIEIGAPNN